MFVLQYPEMPHELLAGGWAPGHEDHRYAEFEEGSAEFTRVVQDEHGDDHKRSRAGQLEWMMLCSEASDR